MSSVINRIMSAFMVAVLSFLLTVAPNNYELRKQYQLRTNAPANYANEIMEAVKTKNVETLENLMCKNIKSNYNDLSKRLEALYSQIEGTVEDVSWDKIDTYSEGRRDGRQIIQADVEFCVTSKKPNRAYILHIIWETVNNFQPEETKIRGLTLRKNTERFQGFLFKLYATNGVYHWHE